VFLLFDNPKGWYIVILHYILKEIDRKYIEMVSTGCKDKRKIKNRGGIHMVQERKKRPKTTWRGVTMAEEKTV